MKIQLTFLIIILFSCSSNNKSNEEIQLEAKRDSLYEIYEAYEIEMDRLENEIRILEERDSVIYHIIFSEDNFDRSKVIFGSSDSLIGKWYYLNQSNDYAEIWFDQERSLLVDASSFNLEILNYSYNEDSIFFTYESDTIYRVAYNGNNGFIKNRYLSAKLQMIASYRPNIEDTEEFKRRAMREFSNRANLNDYP